MIRRKPMSVPVGSTAAASQAGAQRPAILLLGSWHLANNNRDIVNLAIEDVLTDARQREIERLVAGLARWNPTRIAIEWPRADQAGLDRRYAEMCTGDGGFTANERDQIGLRLARDLKLAGVDAIDWNGTAPGDPSAYDFIRWAREHGQGDRFDRFVRDAQDEANRTAAAMRTQTVSQWYRALNTPAERLRMHQPYFTLAGLGSDADNPGAAWVGGWYARNLRIFNNLRDLLAPGERVLVLYGCGHTYLLDRFIAESAVATQVDPRHYIPRH